MKSNIINTNNFRYIIICIYSRFSLVAVCRITDPDYRLRLVHVLDIWVYHLIFLIRVSFFTGISWFRDPVIKFYSREPECHEIYSLKRDSCHTCAIFFLNHTLQEKIFACTVFNIFENCPLMEKFTCFYHEHSSPSKAYVVIVANSGPHWRKAKPQCIKLKVVLYQYILFMCIHT